MRATLDIVRTVEEFPTYARHTTMHTTSREQATPGYQHPTSRDVSTRMHRQPVSWPPIQFRALRGCQLRGCRFSIPPVAAPADSQSLPYPSRKPPLAAASTCTSSPQSKKHISPETLLVRSALSSRYLPSSMPALDSPKRARSCAFPRSTPKRPPAPSSSPSCPAQPSPPPTPSVITLLPASRARRARSHTFRFSS